MVMNIIHCFIEHILRLDGWPVTRNHNTIIILFVHDIFIITLSNTIIILFVHDIFIVTLYKRSNNEDIMNKIHFCIEHILRLDGVPIIRNHNTIIILFFHDIFIVTLSKRFKTCIDDYTLKLISPWKLVIHGFKTFLSDNVYKVHVIICP